MQTKLAYHGKTINLTSDNTIITSTNFAIDKNGNITAKGGTIGGFTLGATQFSTSINGIYNYNIFDARLATCVPLEYITNTSITSSLFDIDNNGVVNVLDAQAILRMANGTQTNSKSIAGTFQINAKNPKDFISIKSNGRLAVSIGVGGVNAHMICAENIVCATQSTVGSFSGVAINGSSGSVSARNFK